MRKIIFAIFAIVTLASCKDYGLVGSGPVEPQKNPVVVAGKTSTPVKQETDWNKNKIGKHRKNPGSNGLVRK